MDEDERRSTTRCITEVVTQRTSHRLDNKQGLTLELCLRKGEVLVLERAHGHVGHEFECLVAAGILPLHFNVHVRVHVGDFVGVVESPRC